MSGEEMIRVDLGDDYYQGAYFSTTAKHLDYEVPWSQLKRWEATEAAFREMQSEIEQVMREQRDRALALAMERRKGQPSGLPAMIQAAYEGAIAQTLRAKPLPDALRGPNYKEPE